MYIHSSVEWNFSLFLDQIAIPDFGAGAMENWGLITYRTQYMLYDPNVTTAGTHRFVAVIVAHELAHMVSIVYRLKDHTTEIRLKFRF